MFVSASLRNIRTLSPVSGVKVKLEAIKTAVSLGLGAAFVSSSAIEKEIELETVEIITIENIKITRTLSIISNKDCYRSKALEFFYNELWMLKSITN